MNYNQFNNPNNLYNFGPNGGPYKKPSSGFAVASMVCGIMSIVLCCCFRFVPIALGILAIVFAAITKYKNGRFGGMAIAGIVCGAIGLAFAFLDIILSIIFADLLAELESELAAMYSV